MNISKHDVTWIDLNQAVVVLNTAILLYVVIALLYLFNSTEVEVLYIIKLQLDLQLNSSLLSDPFDLCILKMLILICH